MWPNLIPAQIPDRAGLWLRVLLMAAKQLKGSGELRICSLNEVVYDSFDMSGFTTILTVTKTEREALDSLG